MFPGKETLEGKCPQWEAGSKSNVCGGVTEPRGGPVKATVSWRICSQGFGNVVVSPIGARSYKLKVDTFLICSYKMKNRGANDHRQTSVSPVPRKTPPFIQRPSSSPLPLSLPHHSWNPWPSLPHAILY